MIHAAIKRPNSRVQFSDIDPDNLDEINGIVGGYVEIHTFCNGIMMLVDEEGRLKGEEANFLWQNTIIVGTVIFAGIKIIDGELEMASLTPSQMDVLRSILIGS